MTGEKPYSVAKFVDSYKEYWGPLSDISVSGIPCQLNRDFRCLITACAADGAHKFCNLDIPREIIQ